MTRFFKIFYIQTRNPPIYNLIDADKDPTDGTFYELIRVLKKKGQTKQCLATFEVTKIPIILHWCHQPQ